VELGNEEEISPSPRIRASAQREIVTGFAKLRQTLLPTCGAYFDTGSGERAVMAAWGSFHENYPESDWDDFKAGLKTVFIAYLRGTKSESPGVAHCLNASNSGRGGLDYWLSVARKGKS